MLRSGESPLRAVAAACASDVNDILEHLSHIGVITARPGNVTEAQAVPWVDSGLDVRALSRAAGSIRPYLPFYRQVDRCLDDESETRDLIVSLNTPKVLVECGMDDYSWTIPASSVRSGVLDMGESRYKLLPHYLENPAMVWDSGSGTGTVSILLPTCVRRQPVVVDFDPNRGFGAIKSALACGRRVEVESMMVSHAVLSFRPCADTAALMAEIDAAAIEGRMLYIDQELTDRSVYPALKEAGITRLPISVKHLSGVVRESRVPCHGHLRKLPVVTEPAPHRGEYATHSPMSGNREMGWAEPVPAPQVERTASHEVSPR